MGSYSESEQVNGLASANASDLLPADLFVVAIASETPPFKLKSLSLSEMLKLGMISKTRSELDTMVSGSALIPGQRYLMTDFQTIHKIVGTSTIIHTGNTENIILRAATTNTFFRQALSYDFPKDILDFDFTDILCEDGTTARKGWITRRRNTQYNIDCDYDFRNVIWRRWAITASTWSSGTTYAANDVVRYNSKIWKSIKGSNLNHTPAMDTTNVQWWAQLFDETITTFLLWQSTTISGLGNVTITPNPSSYGDFYTFVNHLVDDSADASDSGFFTDFVMRCNWQSGDSIIWKTGNNNVFIRDSADTTPRGFDGNLLYGVYGSTFICRSMFNNVFGGRLRWGNFYANIITIPGESFFSNTIDVKGSMLFNTISGGSFHNNLCTNMNQIGHNSFSTKASGNTYGFYNCSFMNCGHLGQSGGGNTFSDVSTLGIFSLFMIMGGDVINNIFATGASLNTITFDVCYHFSDNSFITSGTIWKIQFHVTGSMLTNTFSSGDLVNLQYIISDDYSSKTITAVANKTYAVITAPP